MRNGRSEGRRLRFPIDMHDDESIPGLIARGVRQHVLFTTKPVLDAAEVRLRNLGWSQLATHSELVRLAHVVRCDPDRLVANAGHRMIGVPRVANARFGELSMPLSLIELNRRRIAPVSLSRQGFHRFAWLNLLLPYCPESLERLVSSCANCGWTLGWHFASGIGVCEACGSDVAASTEAALPAVLAPDYRLFAALASTVDARSAAARAELAEPLRTISSGTLLRLAVRLGGLVIYEKAALSSRVVKEVPKPSLAAAISHGTALLRDWPTGVRGWLSSRADELAGDFEATTTLRLRLLDLASRRKENDELVDVLTNALPDLRQHSVHAFAGERRYYLFKETQTRLRLSNAQMETLRDHPLVGYKRASNTHYQQGRFDADRIDDLEEVFRSFRPFNSCASRLKLPLYAIEQCCRPGLLKLKDHPVFVAVRSGAFVELDSLDTLVTDLVSGSGKTGRPDGLASLHSASKRIGGRLKPWGSILQALVEKRIPYWLDGSSPNARSIRVLPADLAPFEQTTDHPIPGVPRSGRMSQLDAAEVLNVKPATLPVLGDGTGLHFAPEGVALTTATSDVLTAAAAGAWDMEVALHLGCTHHTVAAILSSRGLKERAESGWCRQTLADMNILPAQPVDEPSLVDMGDSAAGLSIADAA